MKSLIFFPFRLFRRGTSFWDRVLACGLWAIGVPACCFISSIGLVAVAPDVEPTPSHDEKETAQAIAWLTTSPTFTLTPSDTYTPTHTFTPSDTPTETLTPSPTNTQTFTPSPTSEEFANELSTMDGLVYLRSYDLRESDGVLAYFEVDVRDGSNTRAFADKLYQQAYQEAIARFGSGNVSPFTFSVILWDGTGPAVSWDWDNTTDDWRTTELPITPVWNPLTVTPTPIPSPVVEKFDKTLYATGQTVNIRACASTNCDILGTLTLGESIKANGIYNDEWYRFEYKNADGWVHETVVSTTRPAAATSAPHSTARSSTQRPQSTIPPSTGSDCPCNQGNTLNCSDFSSQSSAQACYNKCIAETGRDVHGLDSGGVAGVACENI